MGSAPMGTILIYFRPLHLLLPCEQELELVSGTKGCAYCGGLGHRIGDCPKLRSDTREQTRKRQDRCAVCVRVLRCPS